MSQSKQPSNAYTLTFVLVLCFSCSLVLSILASVLREPQEKAQKIEQSTQMLLSAQIYNPAGYLQLLDADGVLSRAKQVGQGLLQLDSSDEYASGTDILAVYDRRIRPFVVDASGKRFTFKEAGLDQDEYISANAKSGYAQLPYKLVYEVLPNENGEGTVDSYIFPIRGFGLWDVIQGYLAVEPDGLTVRGISWYQHAETPGLGAEITEPWWQSQFPGKRIFLIDPSDPKPDLNKAPIGITVVRGLVKDVLGEGPKASSAVDGMAGATLTGVGVSKAYKDSLEEYRSFLVQVNSQSGSKNQ